MLKFLRLLTRRTLLVVHLLVTGLFLLACCAPVISPSRFWPISFLGLAFPFLLALVLAFGLCWLLVRSRRWLISLGALLAGWYSVSAFFGLHVGGGGEPPPDSFRVMSYNVRYFKDFDRSAAQNAALRAQVMDLIKTQKPDILCLQEFYTSESPRDVDNKAYISREMGLPYRYFSSDHNYGNNHSGVILFSRYPLLHPHKVPLQESSSSESVVCADLVIGKDTLRLFTMHLQSIYLNRSDLAGIERARNQEDSGLVASRVVLGKLRRAFLRREAQARTVAAEIARSPYPVIICGDFNDTPNSYAYFKIRGHLQDAFLQRGLGIGRTYNSISPTLRIDYILASGAFQVHAFHRIRRNLSDHYPIVATLSLKTAAGAP